MLISTESAWLETVIDQGNPSYLAAGTGLVLPT
uniref:Uncharacterized protein n=1 Tax=Ralstonia solanacearum TaxID=305 RepID=A0A0S4W093_RALSL|nr:protein of unknown function [Ralstonia solanacearum]CUV36590.1 protein of unknown function [Ralstonia solanacearum]CUV39753.1 protein of unknown function [Ralstonia solanacearum]CUV55722.1 protein of unknown function [Ralstonia solanacearum]